MIESYFKVARKKNVEERATQKVVSQVYLNMDEIHFFFRNKSDIFTNIYLCLSLVFNIKPKMAYFLS